MLFDRGLHLPQQRLQPGLQVAPVGGGILVFLLEQEAVLFEHLLGEEGPERVLSEPVGMCINGSDNSYCKWRVVVHTITAVGEKELAITCVAYAHSIRKR
jgi:hypothetical protein